MIIIDEFSNISEDAWNWLLDRRIKQISMNKNPIISVNIRTVITIDDVDYPVLYQFPILIKGWELDSDGYIIKIDGKHRFVWSDHGDYYLVSDTVYEKGNSAHMDILSGFIADYKNAIEKTQFAITLLSENAV